MDLSKCMQNRRLLADEFKACRQVFAALGDETRQLIILAMLENPAHGMRVGEISGNTHLSRPAVSHHLKILKDVGIIAMYRQSTKNYYYVNTETEIWKNMLNLVNHVCEISEEAEKIKKLSDGGIHYGINESN